MEHRSWCLNLVIKQRSHISTFVLILTFILTLRLVYLHSP
jgi:hypothetical protein